MKYAWIVNHRDKFTVSRLSRVPSYPGFVVGSWYGLFAPRGTPSSITSRLQAEVNRFLRLPQTHQALDAVYMKPLGGTPEHQ